MVSEKKNQGTETRHELCVSDFCPPTFCHVLAPVLGHLYDSKRHPTLGWKSMDRIPHCSGQSLPLVKGDGLQMCSVRLLMLEVMTKCECLFGVKARTLEKCGDWIYWKKFQVLQNSVDKALSWVSQVLLNCESRWVHFHQIPVQCRTLELMFEASVISRYASPPSRLHPASQHEIRQVDFSKLMLRIKL